MLSDIALRFDNALREKFKDKTEVLNFLLKHERKKMCIDKLCDEIIRAEKYSIQIRVETYAGMIKDIAVMFASACLKHVEEAHYSSIQRQQILAKENHLKEAQWLLKDLEKDSLNEKGLTQIERDEIKQAIKVRQTHEVQT